LNAVLQAEQLPAGIANLNAGLTNVDADCLAHFLFEVGVEGWLVEDSETTISMSELMGASPCALCAAAAAAACSAAAFASAAFASRSAFSFLRTLMGFSCHTNCTANLYTGFTTAATANGLPTIAIPGATARLAQQPIAGKILSPASQPRQIQFALKLTF